MKIYRSRWQVIFFFIVMTFVSFKCLALDYADVAKSTYRVFTLTDNGEIEMGSGIKIGNDQVLTNCHVVANAKKVMVEYSVTGKRYPATGISADQARDACVLRVNGTPGISISQARFVSNGDTVYVLGYPQSDQLHASKGLVLDANYKLNNDIAIHTDNYCAPGSSGGPLLNARGQLVGLIFAGHVVRKTCFAVPAYYLQRVQSGTFAPFSTGSPIRSKGSVYHDDWRR